MMHSRVLAIHSLEYIAIYIIEYMIPPYIQ
jgi:hypothetical protein